MTAHIKSIVFDVYLFNKHYPVNIFMNVKLHTLSVNFENEARKLDTPTCLQKINSKTEL